MIIGCSANEKTVEHLKDIIAKRKSLTLPVPKLYRAFRHNNKFRLVIKRETLDV